MADNDFALFAGNSASVPRLLYQNIDSWMTQISSASTFQTNLNPGETELYLLGMGGGQENISGTLNSVNITSVGALMSSDIAGYLTGYNATAVAASEPSTYALFGLGALALIVAYRVRSRKAA